MDKRHTPAEKGVTRQATPTSCYRGSRSFGTPDRRSGVSAVPSTAGERKHGPQSCKSEPAQQPGLAPDGDAPQTRPHGPQGERERRHVPSALLHARVCERRQHDEGVGLGDWGAGADVAGAHAAR